MARIRFEAIFNELVRQAKELGAVKGEKVATDATSVGTNANPKMGSDKRGLAGATTPSMDSTNGYTAHIICVDAEEDLPLAVITTGAENQSFSFNAPPARKG